MAANKPLSARQIERFIELVGTHELTHAATWLPRSRHVRAPQRIALGQDATATARDRLAALEALRELGPSGTTNYLEQGAVRIDGA